MEISQNVFRSLIRYSKTPPHNLGK
uniref:Uncharacterized protein n=1 Tax=Anguilla anguilla TaxID=7936 RepID=A0A0E9VV45_ANGAN